MREDKPATEIRRSPPHPKPAAPKSQPTPAKGRGSKRLPVPAENILQLLPDAVVPSREELAAYWETVADDALPYLGRRPLKLVRHRLSCTFRQPRLPRNTTRYMSSPRVSSTISTAAILKLHRVGLGRWFLRLPYRAKTSRPLWFGDSGRRDRVAEGHGLPVLPR